MDAINELAQTNYTLDDFLNSTAPYEEVYRLVSDPFKHQRAIQAMAAYATTVKFNAFKKTYDAYCNSLKSQSSMIYIDNTTMFTGQPLELDAGTWEADDTGIFKITGDGKNMACHHPVMPIERLVNIDTGVEKIRLAYRKGRSWREMIVDKSIIASAQKVTSLADRGISVTSETAKNFVSYMSDLENLNYEIIPESKSIGRLGYIEGEGFSPYVDDLIFDGDANFKALFSSVREFGSFDTWLETAKRCRQMSITARILLAASFASPLLEILGALPFFVHLWGVDSGTGKTVALMLAASVWGDPAVGSYIKTFDATVVGHEKTAAFLNHLPLCLDELQLAKDGKGGTKFDVYKLAQGVGRTRGNKSGGVDMTPTWRNCILTTGESPITSSSAGAGAVNRVIDIECRSAEAVIKDGMNVAAALKLNYGHAGKRFVERIYGIDGAKEVIVELYQSIFRRLSARDTTEKQAMAAAAVMTADKLATEWFFNDGLGLAEGEIAEFLASKAAVSAGQRAYDYLCDWIEMNQFHFFGNDPENKTERWGGKDDAYTYIIRTKFNAALEEAGYSPNAVLSYLRQKGLIETSGKGFTKSKRFGSSAPHCIWLKNQNLEEDVEMCNEIL